MKGKTRILLDVKPEYKEIVETLSARIQVLNRNINSSEEEIKKIQSNLKGELKYLSQNIEARNQILNAFEKLKLIKKKKDIDVEISNPSEKISIDNPRIEIHIAEEDWKNQERLDEEKKKLEKEKMKENANNSK